MRNRKTRNSFYLLFPDYPCVILSLNEYPRMTNPVHVFATFPECIEVYYPDTGLVINPEQLKPESIALMSAWIDRENEI